MFSEDGVVVGNGRGRLHRFPPLRLPPRQGAPVICVDNLDTVSLHNITHIHSGDFTFLNHDLTEPLFLDEPVDFVFHLASPASPIDYQRLPLHTLRSGRTGLTTCSASRNSSGPVRGLYLFGRERRAPAREPRQPGRVDPSGAREHGASNHRVEERDGIPPVSADEPHVRYADITRALQLLGWEPEVDLEEGLVDSTLFC
jgi:nucleoside-diphosphate-sugar epimerase